MLREAGVGEGGNIWGQGAHVGGDAAAREEELDVFGGAGPGANLAR